MVLFKYFLDVVVIPSPGGNPIPIDTSTTDFGNAAANDIMIGITVILVIFIILFMIGKLKEMRMTIHG